MIEIVLRPFIRGLDISAVADDDSDVSSWPTTRKGGFVEALLIPKCLSLGWRTAIPWPPGGPWDLIIERDGRILRIQVKAAFRDKCGAYKFHTTGGTYGSPTYTAKDVDILACYVAPLKIWYIIPIASISPNQEYLSVKPAATGEVRPTDIGSKATRQQRSSGRPRLARSPNAADYEQFRNRWDLLR